MNFHNGWFAVLRPHVHHQVMAVRHRYEDRFGAYGAALYRSLIPFGLAGLPVVILPAALVLSPSILALYPIIVLGVAYGSIRNVVLTKGRAKIAAAVVGLLLTGFSAWFTYGVITWTGVV